MAVNVLEEGGMSLRNTKKATGSSGFDEAIEYADLPGSCSAMNE